MAGRKTGHFIMEKALNRLDLPGFSYNRVAAGQPMTILPITLRIVSYQP
jgi:hypothetical protein